MTELSKIKEILERVKANNPYPEEVFREPSNWKEITEYLERGGYSPEAIFGSWGRYVWNACIDKILKEIEDD